MRFRIPRRLLVSGGLALAIATAVAVVGFHAHTHAHGDLRVIDAEGNVRALGTWRLGASAGGELTAVPSGELRFELTNADGVAHDFALLRVPDGMDGAEALPALRRELERAGEAVGAVEAVAPGEAGGRTFHLPPGRYVLYCDIAGHYEGGMAYTLEVE